MFSFVSLILLSGNSCKAKSHYPIVNIYMFNKPDNLVAVKSPAMKCNDSGCDNIYIYSLRYS